MNFVPLFDGLDGCADGELYGANGTTDGNGGLWVEGVRYSLDPEEAEQISELLSSGAHVVDLDPRATVARMRQSGCADDDVEYVAELNDSCADADEMDEGNAEFREKIRKAEEALPDISGVLNEMLDTKTSASRRDELFDAFADSHPDLPFLIAAWMGRLPYYAASQLLSSLRGSRVYEALMRELNSAEDVVSA